MNATTDLRTVKAYSMPAALTRVLGFPTLLASIVAFCVNMLVSQEIVDPDIWWHLRNAGYQLQAHAFLHHDLYSFTTPGASWMNHEWLAELPFYAGWRLLGLRGLVLVTLITLEAIFLAVFYLAYRQADEIKPALPVALLAVFLSTISFGPRTLLFGWLCLLAELHVLQAFLDRPPRTQRKAAWLLPLLFLVWVNTHGSWLIGMVVLFAFASCGWARVQLGSVECAGWSREQRRTLLIAVSGSVAALFVNPYGWRLVFYPFNLAFRQKLNIANVEEWVSLDFHSPRGHVLLIALTLLFFAQLARREKRVWAPYELAYIAIGVYSAFTYSRFLFLAAILICPLLAKEIRGLGPYQAEKNKPWLNAGILCGLMIFAARQRQGQIETSGPNGRAFPEQALPYLRAFQPQGRVLNDYLWGGYLEFYTPHIPTFVDSRVDIFEYAGVFKDYLDVIRLKNSLGILDKYKIRYVLFQKDAPLVYLLQNTQAWKTDYEDGSTILLERASQASR